jgi:uncharacterized protein YoaH (UPF0181 family)
MILIYFALALVIFRALFRLFAPAHAQQALALARRDDLISVGIGAGAIALLVLL